MTKENQSNIETRWKLTDAFVKGVCENNQDISIWYNTCDKSNFNTSFSTYTSVEKTYIGMLDNVNYFLENCSNSTLLDYIKFYESELGRTYKDMYISSINSHKGIYKTESDYGSSNWWESHLNQF